MSTKYAEEMLFLAGAAGCVALPLVYLLTASDVSLSVLVATIVPGTIVAILSRFTLLQSLKLGPMEARLVEAEKRSISSQEAINGLVASTAKFQMREILLKDEAVFEYGLTFEEALDVFLDMASLFRSSSGNDDEVEGLFYAYKEKVSTIILKSFTFYISMVGNDQSVDGDIRASARGFSNQFESYRGAHGDKSLPSYEYLLDMLGDTKLDCLPAIVKQSLEAYRALYQARDVKQAEDAIRKNKDVLLHLAVYPPRDMWNR
jgi:hypothetical protein